MKRAITVFIVFAAAMLSGCTITTLRSGDDSFTRYTLGANTQVAKMTVKIKADGSREISVSGYDQDQSDAFAAAAEGATKAILDVINPVPLP